MSDKSAEGRRDPAVLRALLDRVQAAKGPDREIDEGVMSLAYSRGKRHIGTEEDSGPKGAWVPIRDDVWINPSTDRWVSTHAFEFTESIDRCVSLLRHALPQSFWSVCDMEDGPVAILVRPTPVGYIGGGVHANGATPPLAFLAALLKSLIANAEEQAHV